jgi:uncharacterized membrane protein YbjE (DUF340 family)
MTFQLWALLKKFGPFAILAGYLALYTTTKAAGVKQILPDLKGITLEKLKAKWQNFAIAAVCGVAIAIIQSPKVKLPQAMKTVLLIALYFLIGWQLATAIDPPEGMRSNAPVAFVPPAKANPYGV